MRCRVICDVEIVGPRRFCDELPQRSHNLAPEWGASATLGGATLGSELDLLTRSCVSTGRRESRSDPAERFEDCTAAAHRRSQAIGRIRRRLLLYGDLDDRFLEQAASCERRVGVIGKENREVSGGNREPRRWSIFEEDDVVGTIEKSDRPQ
jgi:hypothetical protein